MPSQSPEANHFRRTLAGRVVYNRPLHFFSLMDVNRVIRGYFIGNKDPIDKIQAIMFDVSVNMVGIVLTRFGLQAFAETAYFIMYHIVEWALSILATPIRLASPAGGTEYYVHYLEQALADLEMFIYRYTPELPGEPAPGATPEQEPEPSV